MANLKPLRCLNLDSFQQRDFIKFFTTLSEKPATTVRFFERTEFYSVHGDDAEFAAKCVFKSTAFLKTMSPGPGYPEIQYVVLSKNNFENFVRDLLLVKNYRVEVYMNHGSSKANEWTLEFKGSPGNLLQFDELLFGNTEMVAGSAIIGLNLKTEGQQKIVGIGCIDPNDRVLSVTEFNDNDTFSELEAIIVLLGPKECLIPSVEGDYSRVKSVLERNGVMLTIRKKTDFNVNKSDLVQDLDKLIRFQEGQAESANALPEMKKSLAMSALWPAIKYLELTTDSTNIGRFDLRLLNLQRYVHLDSAAVSALNLFPKPGTPVNSQMYKWQSVLGVLDRCRTAQGHRLMEQWLKAPLRSADIIKDRHDVVECLLDSMTSRTELYDEYLKRMPDIMMLTKKLLRKKASLQDIYRLYQVVLRIPRLLTSLANLDNVTVNNILHDPLKDTLADLIKFKKMVEQIVDLEAIDKGDYIVRASFDEQLQELKSNMDAIEEKMQKQLDKAAKDLDLDKSTAVKLDYVSHLGYHFRISLKDDQALRNNSTYRTIDAIKGGVRFTTDRLSSLNDDYSEARSSYEEHQKTIVEEVMRISMGYFTPLSCLNQQIAQLDCLVSFAVAAATASIPYIRPTMFPEGEGILELKELRHPCLELQDNVSFIPNDVFFKKDDTHMHIITGPNMGGKSTYIRSVGTAVLMAHVGAFVPCAEAKISIVDSILGRVGAEDCITKGLSTFMVEMIETSGIIRTASANSLVIIDELGRGTSTYDGCGIAWSIAEHLSTVTKCFTLFATHFHEITELAEMNEMVKNCHMVAIADSENFTLLYQVRPGVMDKSFGIHVAKLANFPVSVLNMAQKVYDESEDHFVHLETQKDKEMTAMLLNKIKEFKASGSFTDDCIRSLIKELKQNVKKSNSKYFKQTFPAVFP